MEATGDVGGEDTGDGAAVGTRGAGAGAGNPVDDNGTVCRPERVMGRAVSGGEVRLAKEGDGGGL